MKYIQQSLLAAVLFFGSMGYLSAQTSDPANLEQEPLMPEQAFQLEASALDADTVRLSWKIAEGYYMYRDKFIFNSQSAGIALGQPGYPPGKIKQDETFGKVETYVHQVDIDIPLQRNDPNLLNLDIATVSQGCSETFGICYQPQKKTVRVALKAAAGGGAEASPSNGVMQLSDFGKKLGITNQQPDFLPPDQAFIFSSEVVSANTIRARWDIAAGYYLYKTKFKFTLGENQAGITRVDLPAGKMKHDDAFGNMEVYHDQVEALLTLDKSAPEISLVNLHVGYQGCAEAGFCYPPMKASNQLNMTMVGSSDQTAGNQLNGAGGQGFIAMFSDMEMLQAFILESNFMLTLTIFYLAGVGLAFTPCVFPMVPILSSIIAGEGANVTTRKAFNMSVIYVLAMAITYTTIGVIAGLATSGLDAMFQNPWVLTAFALIFVLLSLSMFGFYNLQLPASWQSKLTEISNRQKGGKMLGVGIMGFLSALIVGPCVAAPLAAAVLYISEQGDPVFGGFTLFAMSIGMGSPLIAIGTSAGKYLPRAGAWMDTVKGIFGLGLLGMAVFFLDRFMQPPVITYLWLIWIVFTTVYLTKAIQFKDPTSKTKLTAKYAGIFATALLTFALFVGHEQTTSISQAEQNKEYRTKEMISGMEFIKVKGLRHTLQVIEEAKSQGRGVFLDVFADWCTYCKQMDNTTFTDARVQAELNKMVKIKIDITDDDDINHNLRQHFKLRTPPPVYIFMDKSGQEIGGSRIYGYKNAEQFIERLNRVNSI